jgi:hypothetical protein
VAVNRDEAVSLVGEHGWYVARESGKGYLVMRCACGAHQETFHKTPSNPNHFRLKAAYMIRLCSRQEDA